MSRIILFPDASLSIVSFNQFCIKNSTARIYHVFPFYNLDGKISNAIYIGKLEYFRSLEFTGEISSKMEQLLEGSIDINIHRIILYPIIKKKIIVDYIKNNLKAEVYNSNRKQNFLSIVREFRYYSSIGWDEEYNFFRILFRLFSAIVMLKFKISLGGSKIFSNKTSTNFLIKKKSKLENLEFKVSKEIKALPRISIYIVEYLIRYVSTNFDFRPFRQIEFNVEWSPLQAFMISKANSKNILTISKIHGALWEPLLHNTFKSKILMIPEGEDIYCSLNNGTVHIASFDYSTPKNRITTITGEYINNKFEFNDTIVFLTHGYTGMSFNYTYDTNFICIDTIRKNFTGRLKVKLHPSESKFVYKKIFPDLCFIERLSEIELNDFVIGYGTSAIYQLSRKGFKVYFLKL